MQLYSLVSAAILRFVGMKKTSFPDATRSKEQFRKVPKWKIAMIFVRMVRHVLACHASKHWNRYGYENWKFNVKAFNRWLEVHDEVITSSPNWKNIDDKLPEVFKVPMTETPKKKVKRRRGADFDISSPDEKRNKIIFDCTYSGSETEDEDDM